MARRLRAVPVLATLATLVACGGSAGPSMTAPASATPATAAPTPATACSVTVEPAIAAPGGWSVAVGRGFQAGDHVSWTQAADDGTHEATWDTRGFELMRPDARGGFGFGLGSPERDAIGHTITATITSEHCSAQASWRVEAANEQTRPSPAAPPAPCGPVRATVERRDDGTDHQVHLIYAVPSDGEDLEFDLSRRLRTSFRHIDRFLRDRLDGHAFRLDTCDGELDVTFLRLDRPGSAYAEMRTGFVQGLETELARRGFRWGRKLYVVLWDGPAQWARLDEGCGGEAGYRGVAVTFLRTVDGEACVGLGEAVPIGEPDTGLAHEIVHLLGLPGSCGRNVDAGGHVDDDPADLMYGTDHTTMDVIDAGHDDYYRHAIAGCPDLADSAFLDPLPADPQLPRGWPAG